jgi:cyclase
MSIRPRVIPSLLLRGGGLVKTRGFKAPVYVGDPINTVRIFNDKGVDELVLLDISATPEGRGPLFDLLSAIASEAFMPLAYGGGIRIVDDARKILTLGFEKVVINTAALESPHFIRELSELTGSQSVVVSIDVRRKLLGRYEVYGSGGRKATGLDPVRHATAMQKMGAGEILLNSIDCDGKMEGYDLELIRNVATAVDIPVIACGGAGSLADLSAALQSGADAVSAGSLFVFHGRHRAVLISYPTNVKL